MKKLFFQILLGILAAFIISAVGSGWFLRHLFPPPPHHEGRMPPEMQAFAELLQRRLQNLPESEWQAELDLARRRMPCPVTVHSVQLAMPPEVAQLVQNGDIAEMMTNTGPTVLIPIGATGRLVAIGPFRVPNPFNISHLLISFSIILPVVGLIAFLLTYPVAKRLKILEEATVRIAGGDLTARADVKSKDAVGSLARRFNLMADRIQSLLESQRHLLQAVSHELRTPISRIGFTLALLSDEQKTEARPERIAAIERDLEELEHLISELLLYCRFDVEDPYRDTEVVAVQSAIEEVVQTLEDSRPDVPIEIVTTCPTPCAVKVNRRYFDRAISNVLLNSMRYANKRIDVLIRREIGFVTVDVADDGPGIPLDKRDLVFQPFTRVDESRSRESGGVGLGLAIVKRIVEAHGGTVDLSVSDSGGACFSLRWPAAIS